MSRLIVKNLPSGMKEDRFRKLFAAFGTLTDCSLKFTKDGKFRKFGFIGFSSDEEARTALSHFHKSFIDTTRITVEFCKSFGDPSKPKAWSKHSQKPDQSEKLAESQSLTQDMNKKKKKKNAAGALQELEKDGEFKEFLAVHKSRNQVATWTNDSLVDESKKSKSKQVNDYLNFDSESEERSEEGSESEEGTESKTSKTGKSVAAKAAVSSNLSDMDYLKSKIVKGSSSSSEDEGSEGEEGANTPKPDPVCVETEQGMGGKGRGQRVKEKKGGVAESTSNLNEATTPYTVKLRGAPFNVIEKNVQEFFVPLKPVAIRIVRNAHGNKTGYVFVDFNSEEEVQKALKRNNDYMGGRYIEVFRDEHVPVTNPPQKSETRPWQGREKKAGEETEDLAESGRLFVRNLSYTCSEDDLEKIFSKYGPLSEIHFPIDGLTKRPKGFAFVTFMIPEHAVKAFAEVDGQVFQGRMLHLLPSTVKKEEGEKDSDVAGCSDFKKQKAAKDKAKSSSSHNWNTLFMGTNAVADAIAQKYSTTKSQVLDHEEKGSMAVRVALGETQLVQDVRQFLLDNAVSLDSFSQATGERSKTVILVKNLPAGTKTTELEEVFGRHGDLGRVLLPEGGITAIVEFLEPTEAKRAFTKLAYTKFQHVPLYLEWAPMGVFTHPPSKKEQRLDVAATEEGKPKPGEAIGEMENALKSSKEAIAEEEEEDEEEEETIPGCTLFIKNLKFTTTEETLRAAFSKVGAVKSCTISKKKDKSGAILSMGFGFVEYKKPEHAQKALRQLQHCLIDEHQLEVKLSERAARPTVTSARKKQTSKKQKSSKILVRNIPFQATVREVRELFSTFGELKTVRLPKKMSGTGSHRGFGFVDFLTKQDAKKAFSALCHSTHLYGRRLVLEWADSEETVEALRRKTAEHFHDSPKKMKSSVVLNDIMEQLEKEDDED
ncbi:probable RNA-binding protein 19 [Rhinatrema bivittatum]|uniref:probable RNA-binding protein 19 n=1 Tax=Rhinatrema bivittatum TaxID=194408 RepID=UPI001126D3F1|nr:probable RNA-binding protein 19 [Rhinatrema bivittatum]XP_029475658.1 probable RNA-binding protein 19 [Rhinatrema bivittatum]XP_029475659.1 probable RNA-binding protein 19 [Rhinatrema bivittatum]XP_029475660.1 probable RNA-binding protein 19 [Rhinatrema bivittatum]